MNPPAAIFNRKLFTLHRERAARRFSQYDFLVREVAENVAERLEDSSRSFPIALDIGCRQGQFAALLEGRGGVKQLVQAELSKGMLQAASGLRLLADEEYLPFKEGAFDLITSVLNLHAVNDLPGALIQLRQALKNNGVFIAALFGGETLTELRQCLMAAELEVGRGVAAHVLPFVETKDAGMLMQRAGFFMPVADSYRMTASYENIFSLMRDVRLMGEGNILHVHKNYGLTRQVLADAAERYHQSFPLEEGRIKATFEIITVTGMNAA